MTLAFWDDFWRDVEGYLVKKEVESLHVPEERARAALSLAEELRWCLMMSPESHQERGRGLVHRLMEMARQR